MRNGMTLRNEKGVTLVELLAVIVIIAMVGSLIMGVLMTIQKQYTAQSDAIGEITDVTIAAKAITRDLRSADTGSVETEGSHKLKLRIDGEEIVYELVDEVLQLNGSDYLYRVQDFYVEIDESKSLVDMKITSQGDKELKVQIVLREEF